MMSQPTSIDLTEEAKAIIAKYPQGRARSALLPLLHVVQDRDGYVTDAGMSEIAEILGISDAEVRSVATFYTMYYLKPKGRTVISVCHNIACTLVGAEHVISALESSLGIRCGQTTGDGEFTLERVECLAACDLAPMLQLNFNEMIGPVDPATVSQVVRGARTAARSVHDAKPKVEIEDVPAASQGAVTSEATGSVSPEPVVDVEKVAMDPVPEVPPLVDSIPLTDEEREITDNLTARRGEQRSRPSPAERLADLPPLDGGVGAGPEAREATDDDDGPRLRPRGAE